MFVVCVFSGVVGVGDSPPLILLLDVSVVAFQARIESAIPVL